MGKQGAGTQIDAHTGEEGAEAGCPRRGPRGSLGQGLEDCVHLLCHSCQSKFKLVLGKGRGRVVTGSTDLCSVRQGGFGEGELGRSLGRRGIPPGEGWRLGSRRRGTVTLERTRPGRWSRTCSRVAAMSISFTPGGWRGHGAAQGVSRGGEGPESLEHPGLGGLEDWAKPGGVTTCPPSAPLSLHAAKSNRGPGHRC